VDTGVDYSGSRGHTPDPSSGYASAYDSFDGHFRLTSQQSNRQIYGIIDGFYDDYILYGANGPDPAEPGRRSSGASFAAGIESQSITPSRLEVSYEAFRFDTDLTDQDSTRTLYTDREKRASVDALLNNNFGDFTLSTGGELSVAGLGDNSVFDRDYFSYDTGITGSWDTGGSVDLELGARILGYSIAGTVGRKMAYLSPEAKLTFRVSDHLQLYLQNRPSTSMPGLSGVYDQNPYLGTVSTLRPTIATVDARGGARMYRGSMRFAVWGGVREYPSYEYFRTESAPIGPFSEGFFEVGYDEARIIHGGGRASLQLPDGIEASLELNLRQARLTDNNTVIPYVAPVRSSLSFGYPFDRRNGLIEITGNVYGSRYVDLANDERVGAYVDLDAEVSYDLTDSFGLYAGIQNIGIGALEQWNRYPHPSFIGRGGLRVFW
jgi:hypothetical protein